MSQPSVLWVMNMNMSIMMMAAIMMLSSFSRAALMAIPQQTMPPNRYLQLLRVNSP